MTIEQMKDAIKKPYDGKKWKERVSKMSDGQVIAIYNKMLNNKQLKNK